MNPLRHITLVLAVSLPACSAESGTRTTDTVSPTDGGTFDVTTSPGEICGNGFDDNGNGQVDEGCSCRPGQTQQCFPGTPAQLSSGGICRAGTQICGGAATIEVGVWGACSGAVLPTAEVCGDSRDSDCDGRDCPPVYDAGPRFDAGRDGSTLFDAGRDGGDAGGLRDSGPDASSVVNAPITIYGDCQRASCPADHPYPVGCSFVVFGGGADEPRGCIASTPTNSSVYFQAGNNCPSNPFGIGNGAILGTLRCSTTPGAALNQSNCPIPKTQPQFVTDSNMCPDVS